MKILRNILGHGFPALWILRKSGNVLEFRVRKKSKLKTMSCRFHWRATQGSGKSTPFAGWYRKCRERPSIMKWDMVQKRWFPSFTEFIDHKDQIRYYPVQDGESLARYLVQEVQIFGEVHPDLLNHIDYAAIGRELETSENYLFTDNGIFFYR